MLTLFHPLFRFLPGSERRLVFNQVKSAADPFDDRTPTSEEIEGLHVQQMAETALETILAEHQPDVIQLFADEEASPTLSGSDRSFRAIALERIQADVGAFVAENRGLIGDTLGLSQTDQGSDVGQEKQDRINVVRSAALISARRVIG